MASFTESATLKVIDQSSAQIRKINAELKKLAATAKSLQKAGIATKDIGKAVTALKDTGKAAKSVAQVADATKKLAAVKLDNTAKGLSQVADATKKLTTASKGAKGAASALVTQANKTAEAAKVTAEANKTAAKETEKKTAAQKAGVQASIVANKVTAKETAAQKTQAKALQQIADQGIGKTKATIAADRAAGRAAQKRADAEKTQNAITEKSLGELTAAHNKLSETQRRLRDFNYGPAERTKQLGAEQKQIEALSRATKAHEERLRNVAKLNEAQGGGKPPSDDERRPGRRGGGERGGGLFGAIGSASSFIAAMAGITAMHALGKAIAEGTKQIGVGETSLKLKQLDTVYKAMAAKGYQGFEIPPGGAETKAFELIRKLGEEKAGMEGGAFLNRGQRTEIYNEALGTTSLNLEGAKSVTAQLEELVRTGVALGQSQEHATDKAYAYAKAADMMTRLTYTNATMVKGIMQEAGTYREGGATPEEIAKARARGIEAPDLGAKNFFDYMQKLQPTIGKEMTGQTTQMIAKYLGATRYGVSNRAFGATMILGEEMGTRAAVGYRQAVKQLSGIEQTKDRKQALADLGLLQVTKGGTKKRPTLIVGDPIDDALLKQNLPEWIAKHVAEGQGGERYSDTDKDPKKRGRLIDQNSPLARAEKLFNRAFNLDFPEDVQALGRQLVGNSNALDTLTSYMYNWKEIKRKLDETDARDPEAVRKATKDSIPLATEMMKNQFTGLMGEVVKSTAPVLVPIMGKISEGMRELGGTIDKAVSGTPEEKAKAQTDLIKGAVAGTALGLPALGAMKLVSGLLSPIAETVGTVAAITQLQDPKTAPMAGAALGLMGAAAALKGSAAAIAFAAGGASAVKKLGLGAAVGAGLYAAVGGSGTEVDDAGMAARQKVSEIYNARAEAQARLKAIEEKQIPEGLLTNKQMADYNKAVEQKRRPSLEIGAILNEERERLRAIITTLNAEHAAAQERVKEADAGVPEGFKWPDWLTVKPTAPEVPKVEPKTIDQLIPGRINNVTFPDIIPIPRAAPLPKTPPFPPGRVPMPRERPAPQAVPFLPDDKQQIPMREFAKDTVNQLSPLISTMQQFQANLAGVVTPLTGLTTALTAVPQALATMENFPERFASTFTTGADQISTAGTTMGTNANSVITSGAASAGAVYGAAAAAAISAAVANVNVNVNANVTGGGAGVNTGTHTPTGG